MNGPAQEILRLVDQALNIVDRNPEQCLEIAKDIQGMNDAPHTIAWAQCLHGMALADVEHEQAKEFLEAALGFAEKAYDNLLFVSAACYLGFINLRQGKIKLLGMYSHDALAVCQHLDYPLLLAKIYRNLGAYYHGLSLFDRAMQYLESAQDIYERHHPELLYPIKGNIGIIYAELKHFDKAAETFRTAATQAKKADDLTTEVLNLSNLQHLLNLQERAEEGIAIGLEILSRMEHVGSSYLFTQVYENLGMSYTLADRFDEGLEAYQRCIDNLKAYPNRSNESALLFAIGMNYAKQSWLPLAMAHFQQSLTMCEDLGDKVGQYKAHEQLAFTYEQQGEYEQALNHFKTYNALEKQVHSERTNSRIHNLIIAHEVEQHQREKALIQDKNQELEALNLELSKLAISDSLTKSYNRRYLRSRLKSHFNLAKRSKLELSIIVCNVDRFGALNRQYSQEIGDMVLQNLASLLQEQRRNYDVVARYGYDEFVLLLPDTSLEHAVALARKIQKAIAAFSWNDIAEGLSLSVSLGVASSIHCEHHQQLLENAETKREDAKYASQNAIGY